MNEKKKEFIIRDKALPNSFVLLIDSRLNITHTTVGRALAEKVTKTFGNKVIAHNREKKPKLVLEQI